MSAPYENTAIVTPMEGQKRAAHLQVGPDGVPMPTAEGFVVPGCENSGPFADPGERCPLSEFREISFAAGDRLTAAAAIEKNEHWIVSEGGIELTVDGTLVSLAEQDVVLMRAGAAREVRAQADGRVVLVRER